MKTGTTLSPCRYDAVAHHALQSANLRPTAILHYDSSAAVLPISQGGPVTPPIAAVPIDPGIDALCEKQTSAAFRIPLRQRSGEGAHPLAKQFRQRT
jgi:hypothetical protein